MKMLTAAVFAAGFGVAAIAIPTGASALPLPAATGAAVNAATAPTAEPVRLFFPRRHFGHFGHFGHRGFAGAGVGIGAAILGGAILGSALDSDYYGYDDYGYDYGPTYYYGGGGYGYGGSSYCASRFRTYDPVSGTYMGYDGLRHPCP